MRSNIALVPAAAGLALALAACDNGPQSPPSEAEPTPASEPSASETPVSIIRPDVIAARTVTPPLAPLELTVPFAEGGDALSAEAQRVLAEVLASEQLAKGWPIVLRGHTDSVGHDEANLRVSRRRAETVANWLIDEGVSEDRIEVIALGEQRPVAPNASPDGQPDEAGRAMNRRVTVSLVSLGREVAEELPPEFETPPNG